MWTVFSKRVNTFILVFLLRDKFWFSTLIERSILCILFHIHDEPTIYSMNWSHMHTQICILVLLSFIKMSLVKNVLIFRVTSERFTFNVHTPYFFGKERTILIHATRSGIYGGNMVNPSMQLIVLNGSNLGIAMERDEDGFYLPRLHFRLLYLPVILFISNADKKLNLILISYEFGYLRLILVPAINHFFNIKKVCYIIKFKLKQWIKRNFGWHPFFNINNFSLKN